MASSLSRDAPEAASTVASGLAFAAAFLVARFALFRGRSFDFANRSISIVHSAVSLYLTAMALDWDDPLARVGGQATNSAEMLALSVSLGYFTYDTICCMCDSLDVVGNLHHVATIAGLVVGVFKGICGTELAACLFLMEVSTPFMHLRQMLRELGMKHTALANINQTVFGVTYIVCRVGLSTPLMYKTLLAPTLGKEHMLVKAGATGIWLVSAFWLKRMLEVALGSGKKKSKADKAE
eukprot:jgi/Tetstr1/456935/TSEL_043605.t1